MQPQSYKDPGLFPINVPTKYLKYFLLVFLACFGLGILTAHLYAKKNTVNCKMFKTHDEAQRYYDTKQPYYYRLYADKNGVVCKELLE